MKSLKSFTENVLEEMGATTFPDIAQTVGATSEPDYKFGSGDIPHVSFELDDDDELDDVID